MKIPALESTVRKVLVVIAALLMAGAFALPDARATEGGGGAYVNGSQGFLAGALPPPGFYFIEYLMHYTSDTLTDGGGGRVPVDFKLNASAAVNRFVYQSDIAALGGRLGAHAILPLVHASADTALGSGSKSGLGDIVVGPFISWHFGKNLHMAAGIDAIMPTGNFDRNELVNIGRNYWTLESIYAVTYLADNGLELSGKFMYDINTENDDTDYKSGQEFHADYAIGYHKGPWTFGVAGYYYRQVTGDSGAGAVSGDNKGQVVAAGPALRYDAKNGVSIEARWNEEFETENRPEGSRIWCTIVAKF